MIISFETERLKEMCLVLSKAEIALGMVNAKALVLVIADIEAHENVEEMLDFMEGVVQTNSDGTLEISFGSNCRAHFVPAGTRFKQGGDGSVIWSTVERLKLIEIKECDVC